MTFFKAVPIDRWLTILTIVGLISTWVYNYAATASDVEHQRNQIQTLTEEVKTLRENSAEANSRLTGVETKVDGIGKTTDQIQQDIRRLTDMLIRRNIAPNGSMRNPG